MSGTGIPLSYQPDASAPNAEDVGDRGLTLDSGGK